MSFAPETTRPTIVLCLSAQQKGIALQELLRNAGYNITFALSIYEAASIISQELPHIIVTEARLTDGDAIGLFDQINNNELLKKIPFIAYQAGAAPELAKKFLDKGFSSFISENPDPKTILQYIKKTITGVSPFFITAKEVTEQPKLELRSKAQIFGSYGQFMITQSTIELGTKANTQLLLKSLSAETSDHTQSISLRGKSDVFTFFPKKHLFGGRESLNALGDIKASYDQAGPTKSKTIAIVGGTYKQLEPVLKGSSASLICVPSITELVAEIKKGHEIGCVFIPSGLTREIWQFWTKLLALFPPEKHPRLLVGVPELPARRIPNVLYIKMPSGLETMLGFFEIALIQTEILTKIIGQESQHSNASIDVKFDLSGSLEGIDESGGIIKTNFPLADGCVLDFENEHLSKLLEDETSMSITASGPSPDEPETFYSRFSMAKPGTSKLVNFEKILKKL